MEIRTVSDSVAIYSDGKRLQVIHDLGDEFVLDFEYQMERVVNIDELSPGIVDRIVPVFKVSGFCSRGGEGMHSLRWAILQFQIFENYIKDNQADLLDWWKNPGGEDVQS
ncbi:TPA: hypothetical protein U1B35_001009 [Streptococcus suis]|nr:hypothetical protein [Streptococcus suis]NQO01173.1 hypothetical protein [Streptococcus suis]NQO07141.1 hypothetical protein [Streptococcus suis]NQO14893.1 hypothetical protein [Streptococcus suis]NQO58114.1 hypothetical protein [Streptococcus suis]